MANAILFDLDGTLLPMNTDQFVQDYIKILAAHVEEYIEPEVFVKSLWNATHEMVGNVDGDQTNEEVFTKAFLEATQLEKEAIWPILDRFYHEVFPTLSHFARPTSLAKQIVEQALQKGYRVGVATNPVFPRAAIESRLQWAEIDHIPFEVVTVYEECCFTKPHIQYYEEICRRMDVKPTECIMVGNDMQEDMVASQIGMRTFLVEDDCVDRGNPQYDLDDRGSLQELYHKLSHDQGVFAV